MILSTSVVWHLMLDIYFKNICAGHLTSKNSKNVKYVNTAFKRWSGSCLTPSNSEDTRPPCAAAEARLYSEVQDCGAGGGGKAPCPQGQLSSRRVVCLDLFSVARCGVLLCEQARQRVVSWCGMLKRLNAMTLTWLFWNSRFVCRIVTSIFRAAAILFNTRRWFVLDCCPRGIRNYLQTGTVNKPTYFQSCYLKKFRMPEYSISKWKRLVTVFCFLFCLYMLGMPERTDE